MWQPYLDVIRQKCSQALHILDRFHIVAKMNKALDEVRAAESRRMAQRRLPAAAEEVALVRAQAQREPHRQAAVPPARSAPLQPANRPRLSAQGRLPAVLDLQLAASGPASSWTSGALKPCARRIEPMKKIARTLRAHRELLLNYFKARKQFSSGVVEGLNNKAKVTMRRSYGFRTFRVLELALYHSLGKLPEPELTHEFFSGGLFFGAFEVKVRSGY